MKKIKLLVLAVMVIGLFQGNLFAEIHGTIKGKIIAEDTKKGIKATLCLMAAKGPDVIAQYKEVITNENGEFYINNLEPKVYSIEIQTREPYLWGDDIFVDLRKGGVKEIIKVLKVGCVVKGRILHDGLNLISDDAKKHINFQVDTNYNIEKFNMGGQKEGGYDWFWISSLPEGNYNLVLSLDNNEDPYTNERVIYPILFQSVSIKKGTENIANDFDLRKENFGELEIVGYSSDKHLLRDFACVIYSINEIPGFDKKRFPINNDNNVDYNRYLLPAGEYNIKVGITKSINENLPFLEILELSKRSGNSKELIIKIAKGQKITKTIYFDLPYDQISEIYK